jgi:hypothetical protein
VLHWYNLMWYGPASFAMVGEEAGENPEVTLSAFTMAVADILASAETEMRATILKGLFLDILATAEAEVTNARLRARVALDVDISARPSAEDIAQAVWGASQTITDQSGTMARAMRLMAAIAANRVVTDPSVGTYTVYDDDDTTVLATGDLWQDAAGTTPYAGSGAERRDRLE